MSKRKTTSGIYKASVALTLKWLEQEFEAYSGKDLKVFQVRSPSNLRDVEPNLKKPDGNTETLSYPFLLYVLGDVSLDEEKGGLKKNHAHGGIPTSYNRVANKATFENLRPVKVAVGTTFRSSSLDDVMHMMHALLMNAPKISFTIDNDKSFSIEISVSIEPSFSTPPAENGDTGTEYNYQSVLTIHTYIGTAFEQGLIQNCKVSVYDPNDHRSSNTLFEGDLETLFKEEIQYTDFSDSNNPRYRGRSE